MDSKPENLPSVIIFSVIDEEYKTVFETFKMTNEIHDKDNLPYKAGYFPENKPKWKIILAQLEKGNPGAGVLTQKVIENFNPKIVLLVGTAAGFKEKGMKLYDLAIPTMAYYYESGSAGNKFSPRPHSSQPNPNMIHFARSQNNKNWKKHLKNNGDKISDVWIEPIASGEKLLKSLDANVYKLIRTNYEDAVAADMEGYGFLLAANHSIGGNALEIRGISDLIDDKGQMNDKGSREKATSVACAFVRELLSSLTVSEISSLERSSRKISNAESNDKSISESNQVFEIEDDFVSQIKHFKKLVSEQYRGKSQNQIIKNFRNFDGFAHSIQRHYQTYLDFKVKNESSKPDISKHVLDFMEKKINLVKFNPNSDFLHSTMMTVVGDYGSGKSTLSHYILYKLCEMENDKIVPIFVPLGDLQKIDDSHEFLIDEIFEFLVREYGFKISLEAYRKLVDKGKLIFILDALDEMSLRLNDEVAGKNLEKVRSLAKKGNLVLLTSRHTYFSEGMDRELISGSELIKILDFDISEINEFVDKKFGPKSDRAVEIKKMIESHKLEKVAQKPLFLDAICENYEDLKNFSIINGAVVLRSLTEKWIVHDVSKKEKLTDNEKLELKKYRQSISEILAFEENRKGVPIGINDIVDQVKNKFEKLNVDARDKLDQYYKDARDSTFLTKEDNDKFKFILKPIMEYFVARKIVNSLNDGNRIPIFEDVKEIRTDATYDFIKGIIDSEWTVKPHVLREIKKNNPDSYVLEYLRLNENKTEQILKLISNTQNENPKPNVSSLVRILSITGNLIPDIDLSYLNISGIKVPNINLSGAKLKRTDLSGSDLSEANLTGANLENTNLFRSKLSGANLSNTKASQAKFMEANLNNANLSNSSLTDADFERAELGSSTLTNVSLNGANVKYANFMNANITGSYLNGVKNIQYANFENTDLSNVKFGRLKLHNFSHFKRTNLRNVDFTGSDLSGSDLSGSYLVGANFQKATLVNAIFCGATITSANFKNAIANKADFSSTDLTRTPFIDAELNGTIFRAANLNTSNFTSAKLADADFENADLTNAKFNGANLMRSILRRANLTNANFSDADLRKGDLYQTIKKNTNFNRALF